ncbi:MAG: hypothetical protein WKF52_06850 [Sphingomicrobium sp.]
MVTFATAFRSFAFAAMRRQPTDGRFVPVQSVLGLASTSTSSWFSQPLAISVWAVPTASLGGLVTVTKVTRAESPVSGWLS